MFKLEFFCAASLSFDLLINSLSIKPDSWTRIFDISLILALMSSECVYVYARMEAKDRVTIGNISRETGFNLLWSKTRN